MTEDWRRGAWLALIVTSTYVALLTLPAATVAWLTDEDTLGTETAGAVGFFLAGIFMLVAFRRVRREGHGGKAFATKQIFLLGMGCCSSSPPARRSAGDSGSSASRRPRASAR